MSFDSARDAKARNRAGFATRDIGGVGVAVLSKAAALSELSEAMAGRRHVKLAFCNANLVNLVAHDETLLRKLAGFLVLADGIGVDIGSWMLYGAPFPANLNGTDFVPSIFAGAARPLHVGLIGGRPGVADLACAQLGRDHPTHRFSVVSHGYFGPQEEQGLLDGLKGAPPDLLLVAFGNPLQERWIADRLGPEHCTVAAGVGALFDFFAGEVPRAPQSVRRSRFEWLYRLWLEPRRLWRRYIIGNPVFLLRLIYRRLFAGRPAQ